MASDSYAANPRVRRPVADSAAEDRRNVAQWDMGLHRGLTRLEIASSTPPRDSAGAWASEVNQAVQAQAEQARVNPPTVRFETEAQVVQIPSDGHSSSGMSRGHQHTVSAPSINTPREAKRHGWYHGPMATTSSGAEGPGDRYSRVERMIHPNLANGFTGFTSTVPQTVHEHPPPVERDPNSDPLRRLEALVAVATSEGSTATAY